MYKQKNLDTEMLLKWSKLLEYYFLESIHNTLYYACCKRERTNLNIIQLPNVLNIR